MKEEIWRMTEAYETVQLTPYVCTIEWPKINGFNGTKALMVGELRQEKEARQRSSGKAKTIIGCTKPYPVPQPFSKPSDENIVNAEERERATKMTLSHMRL